MKRLYFFVLLGLVVHMSCTPDQEDFIEPVSEEGMTVESALEAEILELVNAYRVAEGLNTLNFNKEAYDIALEHSMYMAKTGKMSHHDFKSRALKLAEKVNAKKAAENLSTNYPDAMTTFQKWLDSNGHRINIEGDFSHTAVAVISTTAGDVYYTQLFYKAD